MPVRYNYEPSDGLVRVDAIGVVTGSEIREYFEALVRESWWQPGMRYLADNRDVSRMPSQADLETGAIAALRTHAYSGGTRVAVMVASTFQFGVVRQFGAFTNDSGAVMLPFYDEAEALAWLREPV